MIDNQPWERRRTSAMRISKVTHVGYAHSKMPWNYNLVQKNEQVANGEIPMPVLATATTTNAALKITAYIGDS